MAVMERKTRAGRTITIQQYAKPAEHKGKRERKNGGTSEAQKAGNMRRAVMMLTWLMNANFQDGDLLVTLDYKKERRPEDSIRMNKDFTNFYNRLKRKLKKAGLPPPRYIRVVEVGSKGARHHHMLLPYIDLQILRSCWPEGGVHVDPLYTDGNYRAIAEYFVKYSKKTMETEQREMKKLWYPSKGLKHVEPGQAREIKSRKAGEIKIPKGYYLDQDSVRTGISAYDGSETLTYIVVRLPDWPPKRKKGGGRHG